MMARLMGLKTVSPAEVEQSLGTGSVEIIDVTSPTSWGEAHVPGAVNLDPAGYTERELPGKRDASLVFYCSSSMCRKAPAAALRARKMGYTDVRVMSAGIRGWLSRALPTERGTAVPDRG